jgi:hypothetical protein
MLALDHLPADEGLSLTPRFHIAPTDRDPAREDSRQRAIVAMARRRGLFCVHIPQSGKRSDYERTSLHRNGAVAGVPDLMIAWAGGVYFAEVKDGRGKPSPAQIEVMNQLVERGIPCGVHRGWATLEAALIAAGAGIAVSPAPQPKPEYLLLAEGLF